MPLRLTPSLLGRRTDGSSVAATLITLARIASVRLGFAAAAVRPLRPSVLLATAHANRLSGNLAAIARELRRDDSVPVVVLAHASGSGRMRALSDLWFHVRAGYDVGRSRLVVVDDYFFPIYAVRPRRGTVVVQAWHGCGALKKMGLSVADTSFGADAAVRALVRIHSHYDVCLVSSTAATPFYAEAFGQPAERFVSALGIPRTDALVRGARTPDTRNAVRARLGIAPDQRAILYAPTFRGSRATAARDPSLLDVEALVDDVLPSDVLLVRMHPFVRRAAPRPDRPDGRIVDVSAEPDVNELMLAADVLVTDYSSTIFEFALLDRPIALFAPDLEAYERERGFYEDYRSNVPGPVFETQGALADWLRSRAVDLEPVRATARRWFDVADGHATERFVDRIVRPALAGHPVRAADLQATLDARKAADPPPAASPGALVVDAGRRPVSTQPKPVRRRTGGRTDG